LRHDYRPHADLELSELDGQAAPAAYGPADLQGLALAAGIPDSPWSFPYGRQAFALMLLECCASIGDKYPGAATDANTGDKIRATFG